MKMFRVVAFAAALFTSSTCSLAQTLASWNTLGLTNYGPNPFNATSSNSSVTVGGLTRGAGVATSGTAANDAWGGASWDTTSAANAIAANDFVTFSISPKAGNTLSLTSLTLSYRRSAVSGAQDGLLQYSINNGANFTDITSYSYTSTTGAGETLPTTPLNSFSDLQNFSAATTVIFRVVNFNATTASGSWYVSNQGGGSIPGLSIDGIVSPVPEPSWIFAFSIMVFLALTIMSRHFG